MRRCVAVLGLVAWLGALAVPVRAEDRPRAAARRVEGAIRLDGALDEPDWALAIPITGFLRMEVREGEASSESTEVRVLAGNTHIYFGIRCANATPGPVRASLTPRDQILDDDHISVHLDTYRDFHRAYIFGVNPYGVQLDGILDGGDVDFSWDASWDAETTRDAAGWTAEIAIPLRALRFPAGGRWGLWFRRQITKNDEVCSWPLYRQAVAGDIMLQAGDLEGLEGLVGGGRVEVQPYAASTTGGRREPLGGSELSDWDNTTRTAAGVDLRYGLTSTLTANLTANPDYSQVEADALQIDVNQRFPLYFKEKRPFFLEGAETFKTLFDLVYTRRIADPAWGAKLTGKLGRWRVGAMGLRDNGGGSTEGVGAHSDGEPARPGYFGLGRAAYDIGENSNVGVLITRHDTDGYSGAVPTVVGFRAPGRGANTLVSIDAKFRLAPSLFTVGQLVRSSTRIDSVADFGSLRGTGFDDWLATGALWWEDGRNFALVYHDYLGPDLRADAGFLERVGIRKTAYEAGRIFRPENRWLRYWNPEMNGHLIEDTDGHFQEQRLTGEVELGFQQQTEVELRAGRIRERWLSRIYDRDFYNVEIGNSLWRALAVNVEAEFGDGIFYADADSAAYLGWLEDWELGAIARPSPRLTAEITAAHSRFRRSRGGAGVYELTLLGAKTTYQFTRRLYARLYPQYDTGSGQLDLDALLAYVLHPGSVVYLGVHGDLDRLGDRRRATGRTLFLKVSYAFQG